MVNPPVFRTSTVIHPNLASYEHRPPEREKTVRYGRYGTPTTFALEEAMVRQWKADTRAAAVPSGLAGISAAMSAFVKAGDHLLVSDSVYARLLAPSVERRASRSRRRNQSAYDPLIGAGWPEDLMKPATRAVFCEVFQLTLRSRKPFRRLPRSRMPVARRYSRIRRGGRPASFADSRTRRRRSIHAATKYISGHSDVMLGIVVTNEQCSPARVQDGHAIRVYRESADDFGSCAVDSELGGDIHVLVREAAVWRARFASGAGCSRAAK